MNVKVIGIGGIGCQLLPTLCRYLLFEYGSGVTITLIDGDTYELRNEARQSLGSSGNKAETATTRLIENFPGLMIHAQGVYIDRENCYGVLQERDIVFLCVDNHSSRHDVSARCEELQDVVLISGGNEFTDGNIQVFIRKDGESLTLPLSNKFHPEIENPSDKNPAELGCDVAVASTPQLLITNNAIATLMLNALYSVLTTGKTGYDEVYVDVSVNRARPVTRS